MHKIAKLIVLVGIIGFMGFILTGQVFAQEREKAVRAEHKLTPAEVITEKLKGKEEGVSSISIEEEKVKRARLEKLRRENPDKFKARRQELLERLRKAHPDRYNEFIKHRRNALRRKYLQRLKEANPRRYAEIIKNHRAKIREHLAGNPEEKERLQEFFRHRRNKDYNSLRDFLNRHPEYRRRWMATLTPEEIAHIKLTPNELLRLKRERPQAEEKEKLRPIRRREASSDLGERRTREPERRVYRDKKESSQKVSPRGGARIRR